MEILWNTHVYNRKVLLKSLKKEKFTNKNGSYSALNMFTEYSMTDPGDLAEYFGFTEQEIYALKIYIQMDMDGLKDSVVRMLAGINYNKKTKKHECVIEVMQK